jgi:YebC/PmpR family DNA-binding regulatory protein
VRYEGYGPGGVAIIVEALTDNRNRTGGAVRAWFTKYGGNLGATGQVSHMFSHVGEITFKPDTASADAMLEGAIDAGADDVQSDDNGHLVTCSFDTLGSTAAALEAKFGAPTSVKAVWKPNLTTTVDQDKAETILKLLGALEEDDDVQNVFSNVEVDEATMAKLQAG